MIIIYFFQKRNVEKLYRDLHVRLHELENIMVSNGLLQASFEENTEKIEEENEIG